ncbi:MAG: hypothetical protein H6597_04185 [Flavobacteriales bacterium]|nr:hypothetical protein [Flavobacteriales bacterium]
MRPFLLFLIGLCTAGASAQTTPGAAWRHLLPAPADRIREVDLLHFDPPPLGLFCKFDVQLEDLLPVPVRFRLGDPLQVDRMEGKGPLSYDTRPPREAEQRR